MAAKFCYPVHENYLDGLQHPVNRPQLGSAVDEHRPEASMVTASQMLGATRSSEPHWRAPSPPHIHIPPSSDEKNIALPPYSYNTAGHNEEDKAILQAITQGHYGVQSKEWKYESRRQAQSILAFLYLGPSSAARDGKFLKEQGITMLLVIRDTATASSGLLSGQRIAKELGIVSKAIDVQGTQELIHSFSQAIETINQHLVEAYRVLKDTVQPSQSPGTPTAWGKVLVWCESGNERSATIVAAYLMTMYDMDLIGAIQYLQTQRFCVAFDDRLKNLLYSYQQILEARRSVYKVTNPTAAFNTSKMGKRGREELDYDMEEDTATADDLARFGGRTFAPFT